MIHAIQNVDVRGKMLKKLSLSLALAGQWEQAERIIRSIESARIQIESWFEVATACTQVQQWEHIQRALAEIDRTLGAIENSDAWRRSELHLTDPWNNDVSPWSMHPIEKSLDTALGDLTRSLIQMHQWRLAEDTIRRVKDLYTRVALLQHLSIALSKEQQWQLAEDTIHRVKDLYTQAALL